MIRSGSGSENRLPLAGSLSHVLGRVLAHVRALRERVVDSHGGGIMGRLCGRCRRIAHDAARRRALLTVIREWGSPGQRF